MHKYCALILERFLVFSNDGITCQLKKHLDLHESSSRTGLKKILKEYVLISQCQNRRIHRVASAFNPYAVK